MANEQVKNEILRTVKNSTIEAVGSQALLGNKLTTTISVDFTSMEGNRYVGDITFKKPDVMTMLKAGAIKAQILKEAGITDMTLVDPIVSTMATVIASLDVVLVGSRPDWVKDIKKVGESELLYHIYDLYMEWQDSFRKTISEEPEGNSGATSPEEAVAD